MPPIPVPDGAAFRRPLNLTSADPAPWVIDASELRDDILRNVRVPNPTMLLRAAAAGDVRLYCAAHVIAEVDEQIRDWAILVDQDPDAAEAMWHGTHRTLLRCVDEDPGLAFTADELDRIAWLESEDRDDVPTARLAMVLQARLASKDGKVLEAVYGRPVPWKPHHYALTPALTGANQLATIRRTQESTFLLGSLGVAAIAGTVRKWPELTAVAGAFLAGMFVVSEHRREHVRSALRSGWTASVEVLEMLGDLHIDIGERLGSHPPPPGDPSSLVNELGSDAVRRLCMWRLARLPAQNATAMELAAAWPPEAASVRAVPAIREELHACSSLHRVSRGRFQLGRPATSAASTED